MVKQAVKNRTHGIRKSKADPRIGYDMLQFTGTYGATGYHSASIARTEGRYPTAGSGDAHGKYDRATLINQSRQFKRENGIYQGMIARAAGYIIGNGFNLQAKTSSNAFNKKAESLWKEFWKKPDVKQIIYGRRLEKLCCEELLSIGEFGTIKTNVDNGLIQLIESEQIVGKGALDNGVDTNDYGRPTNYHVAPWAKNGGIDRSKSNTVSPNDFLFVVDPDRLSSTRGVPPCQAVFPMLHRINDVCDSEAIAWQLLARLAVSITKEMGPEDAFNESKPDDSLSDTEGRLDPRIVELGYALIFNANPGEEIKGIDRNIPGKNFTESLLTFLRLLGLPLGLPLEIVLLDWTKSNYSQSRAVLEQAYQSFIGWQTIMSDMFMSEIYRWKIQQWIDEGLLRKRKDAFRHDWIMPTFPWIDQLKEAQAQGAKLDRTLTTHGIVLKGLNLDREDVLDTREQEYIDAIERAERIEKKTGVKVPWQPFAGLEVASAKPAKENTDKDDEDDDDAEDDK